jgi:hypothetical protein
MKVVETEHGDSSWRTSSNVGAAGQWERSLKLGGLVTNKRTNGVYFYDGRGWNSSTNDVGRRTANTSVNSESTDRHRQIVGCVTDNGITNFTVIGHSGAIASGNSIYIRHDARRADIAELDAETSSNTVTYTTAHSITHAIAHIRTDNAQADAGVSNWIAADADANASTNTLTYACAHTPPHTSTYSGTYSSTYSGAYSVTNTVAGILLLLHFDCCDLCCSRHQHQRRHQHRHQHRHL